MQTLDRYTPVRFAHGVAKRLGLSRKIVEVANASLRSERSMRAAFAGYTPTERDVVVATFVKSGTNWAMQICQQVAHRGAAEFEHIHDLVPWPDNMDGRPIGLDDPASWRDSPTGLRVIKTHLAEAYVPLSDAARYVVVVRDPKEVVVSSYYFLAPLLGVADTLDPDDWLDLFVARRVAGVEAWVDHALGWWGLRDAPEVLVLFFAHRKQKSRMVSFRTDEDDFNGLHTFAQQTSREVQERLSSTRAPRTARLETIPRAAPSQSTSTLRCSRGRRRRRAERLIFTHCPLQCHTVKQRSTRPCRGRRCLGFLR